MKTVLVTGVGGNVGQGILRNIRRGLPDISLVGLDIAEPCAGAFFADSFFQVPFYDHPEYIPRVASICESCSVDLIIPATDYEVFELASHPDELPAILASPPETSRLFLDKMLTSEALHEAGIAFAESQLPSRCRELGDRNIVKPREGRGSRDVHRDCRSLEEFDDTFVVQKRYEGTEITSAFYITARKDVLGPITFKRTLSHGMTDKCWVLSDYDVQVKGIADQLNQHFDLRGPINIQSIADAEKVVTPFEINCRYSGTNSVRAHFGFDDVCFGVREWLFDERPPPVAIAPGYALRVFMDIIYPGGDDSEENGDRAYLT